MTPGISPTTLGRDCVSATNAEMQKIVQLKWFRTLQTWDDP